MMLLEKVFICGVVLLVIIFTFLIRRAYSQYNEIIEEKERKKEDELYKEKKRKELEKFQEILRENQKDNVKQVYEEDLEIVDIAKPLGKWTKMVMQNSSLNLLAQLIRNKDNKKGFWQLFIKSQASTQGKYKGRGR